MERLKQGVRTLGKSLMMPISVISVAGIFLGLAAALQNPNITGQAFQEWRAVQVVLSFVRLISGALFGSLPLLFAIAVAVGMAREEKATAAFSSALGFMLMHKAISFALAHAGINAASMEIETLTQKWLAAGADPTQALIQARMENAQYTHVLGIFSYNMNIFGGIVAGMCVGALHNRFWDITFPDAINFYGGRRFVPIITACVLPFVGLGLYFVWPFFGQMVFGLGGYIENTGLFGTFLFGFSERLLIPTGLHHILNQVVRFTPVGGMAEIGGTPVVGALNIFNTAMANNFEGVSMDTVRQATRFLAQGKIPIMMFALPAAAFAMYRNALPENRTQIESLMFAAAITSFLTGITEPLEFSFIFVSPFLFLFHAFATGLSFMLASLLQVAIGNVQGGAIDLLVFGILGGARTAWYWDVLIGLGMGTMYYFVFDWAIRRFGIMTPGREASEVNADSEAAPHEGSRPGAEGSLSWQIMTALGGKANISSIDNCFTRLRLNVLDAARVDKVALKATGAQGVICSGQDVQVVYGPKVEQIAREFKALFQS